MTNLMLNQVVLRPETWLTRFTQPPIFFKTCVEKQWHWWWVWWWWRWQWLRIAMTVLMMATTMTRCQGWRCPRCFWAEDMFPFTDLARHLTSMTHNHWLLSDTNNFRTLPRAGCLLFHNLCTFVLEWFGNGESLCVKISWTRIPKITFEYSFRLAPIEIH